VPCIGCRPDPAAPNTMIYAGQRRYLAAQAGHQLAGSDGFEGLTPVQILIVLPLDHQASRQPGRVPGAPARLVGLTVLRHEQPGLTV
jgi:hypothetical protein